MKELFKVFAKDIEKENFTKKEVIIFGVIAPLAFVLVFGFAGWLMK